jgi:YD repeat-containing protein
MKNYFKRRGWKDLIFLLVVLAGSAWVEYRFYGIGQSDVAKWKRRADLDASHRVSVPPGPGQVGLFPCFFIVPNMSADQPVESDTIGDCLLLTPDGKKLDLFEIFALGGFLHIKTDLYVPGAVPIALTRTTAPPSDGSRRNKIYLPHVYDPFLSGSRFPYTYLDWSLPDGQSIHFGRISKGSGFEDAVYEAASNDPTFAGSRISWNGFGWDLVLANGTTYLSPEAYNATRSQQGSLVGVFDSKGNEVRLSRAANGDLKEIKSGRGSWIRLRYDENERVTRADASSGEFVEYSYDGENELTRVQYSTGETIEYAYDSRHRIVGVDDAAKSVSLMPVYDGNGTIIGLRTDPTHRYTFDHRADKQARMIEVEIADPQGRHMKIDARLSNDKLRYSVESHVDIRH